MSSRVVCSYDDVGLYIIKKIPFYSSIEGMKFPSLDECFDNDGNLNLNFKQITELEAISAVEQQYNEWWNWFFICDEFRNLLAPIVQTTYDYRNLPILMFPRFSPLMDEEEVDKYSDEEILIRLGMKIKEHGIKEEECFNFLNQIYSLCDYLNLNKADIINNPSNIGYNPIFGLRIIDYGLLNT